MRFSILTSLLVTVCLLAGTSSLAQRAAVAPLVPRVTTVPPAPDIRVALSQENLAVTPVFDPGALPYWKPAPIPDPLFILNSSVIINGLLKEINPNNIKKLVIYKGADAPQPWRSLAGSGIVDITLKKKRSTKIKSLKLAEIGQRLLLSGPVRYSVNGMRVAETDLRIATAAISDIRITPATPSAPVALVEIQTIPLGHEMQSPAPPGTIRIRGVASY